ncbi:exocyst complex component EXO70B1-like [Cucurbita pepo subsp. pepo]|uniref:exocyst complex component EXO70B1-like n=1 Tax=Cucurbita pepo subsp. pepo TaxID=3664 RepID=UPI000C9D934A|nr:exocyst complex component EXO70B1-like [Cucurbita pepo subsp. pepo]
MDEAEALRKLVAARQHLKTSLDKSRDIASALANAGPRLRDKARRLASLEVELVPIQKCNSFAVGDQIDHVVGLASALFNVINTVSELQKSLVADSCSQLSSYLSVMERFENAFEFLSDNCSLIIQWLEGIVQFVEDNRIVNDQQLLNVKNSLENLRELQVAENNARIDGGPLSLALNKLEFEFRRLLRDHSVSLHLAPALLTSENQDFIGFSLLPESIVQKLQLILTKLKANDQIENCISIYIEIRSSNAELSLRTLGLDYLETSVDELSNMQSIEDHINRWSKHLELAVKHLYEPECKLCNDIFEKIEPEVRTKCFAKIASQSGFLPLLQFGRKVTQTKKDPIKLLNLLDIFLVLDNLRTDINKLFGGKACTEIQATMRDLVKHVVNGICDVFSELPIQVELQRQGCPPVDGGIPSLVSFVTDYCNKLLGNHYKPILNQILIIHQSWEKTCEENLLENQIYLIIKELALNLDSWAKAYQDMSKSYYFMMNNHCHFSNLKGSKLGEMMGDEWLNAHSQYKEYYAALYLRESWGELLSLLNQKGQLPYEGEKWRDIDLLKKRVKMFSQAFEQTCKRQSKWVISDEGLRERICLLLVQAIVPVYMKNFEALIEQDRGAAKYLKYTAESMGTMISSLFRPMLSVQRSRGHTHARFITKIKSIVTHQFRASIASL